jgi:hypothetical protein
VLITYPVQYFVVLIGLRLPNIVQEIVGIDGQVRIKPGRVVFQPAVLGEMVNKLSFKGRLTCPASTLAIGRLLGLDVDSHIFDPCIFGQDHILGVFKNTVQSAQPDKGQDNPSVHGLLVVAPEYIGHRPDKAGKIIFSHECLHAKLMDIEVQGFRHPGSIYVPLLDFYRNDGI